ncbi:hypothetical protein RhiLY_13303 [Ceratobasidium sp. AG-Ba]|nr:hypothetical protein RhiLY_13303 [Ceratobasidium sp. AG-Ba]
MDEAGNTPDDGLGVRNPTAGDGDDCERALDSWLKDFNESRRSPNCRKMKDIVCPIPGCNKSQRRLHVFKDHLCTHLGIKLHPCKYCMTRFSTADNCKRHEKRCDDGPLPEI